MDDIRVEVVVLQFVKADYCTYCHRKFGDLVRWHGRNRFLGEEWDHVIPKVLGGRVTVPCCSLCNRIKGALKFDSLVDIQDYCLDRLLRDGSITVECARSIKIERAVRVENVTPEEVARFCEEEVEEIEALGPLVTLDVPMFGKWRIAERTRRLEADLAAQRRKPGYCHKCGHPKETIGQCVSCSFERSKNLDQFSIDDLPKAKTNSS